MNAASWLEGFPAPEKWRSLLLTQGPRIATWTLALALGVQAAVIVTDLAGAGRSPTAAGSGPSAAVRRRPGDVAGVTPSPLFGAAPVGSSPGEGAADPAPTRKPLG